MYNTIIIEDEVVARDHLKKLISIEFPEFKILNTLSTVSDSIKWFQANDQPSLIFMDIQLSDGISFDILENIDINCPIIYTTAYDEYAIQAFKTSGIDYLLKPITKNDLDIAIKKFKELKKTSTEEWFLKNISILNQYENIKNKDYKTRFLLKKGKSIMPLKIDDIAYFYRDEIVFAKTTDGSCYPLDESLNQLQKQLNPNQFLRINRQLLINNDAINKLMVYKPGQLEIYLIPEFHKPIYLSQERSSWLRQFLSK